MKLQIGQGFRALPFRPIKGQIQGPQVKSATPPPVLTLAPAPPLALAVLLATKPGAPTHQERPAHPQTPTLSNSNTFLKNCPV